MSRNNARTVTATANSTGILDIKSLVLLAILLAAGFILNLTLGNALAIVGIKPQFIIAAYALAILLIDANYLQAIIFAVISACVIQLTTSIPGLNFVTETVAALAMVALVKSGIGGKNVNPLAATFITTLISGALFAVLGTVIMGGAIASAAVKIPLVLGTSVFNAILVQALSIPLKKVFAK